jgi:hypothetical protein
LLRFLALLAAAVVIVYPVYARTRRRAQASAEARRRLIVRSVAGVAVGLVVALWLPRYVPETPGSPGTIVGLMLLWLLGGSMAFLNLVALVGAIRAHPDGEQEDLGGARAPQD